MVNYVMAKIDEIKTEIDWLKDLFKIIVAVLVAIIAGISKLYVDDEISVLFYLGIIVSLGFTFWIVIIAKKIKKHIKELGGL